MKTALKIATAILLSFNGVGAIYGGWSLISYPDGSSIGLSLSLLVHTPFSDYIIPGIVLFVMNGLLSLVALGMLISKRKNYWVYVLGEGVILFGWLVIQILLIRTIYWLQLVLGGVALLLILCGLMLRKTERIPEHLSIVILVFRWEKCNLEF